MRGRWCWGRGTRNPFLGHTGPTTWIPPLYTLLVAAVFKVFGIYTAQSAWVIFALNSVFSAATALCVYEIAARCYGQEGGAVVGVAVGAVPGGDAVCGALGMGYEPVDVAVCRRDRAGAAGARGGCDARETGTAAGDGQRVRRWAWFGLLWGMILLSNPSLVLALPAMMLWMVWGGRRSAFTLEHAVRGAVVSVLVMGLCLAPWVARNWTVFHVFIPTRGNLGAELYQSTLESNNGFPWGGTLPMAEADPMMRRYAAIGEVRYVREQGVAAKARIRENPRRDCGMGVEAGVLLLGRGAASARSQAVGGVHAGAELWVSECDGLAGTGAVAATAGAGGELCFWRFFCVFR